MLKAEFCERMKRLLGDSYQAFEEALGKSAPRSIRINPIKISEEEFLSRCELSLTKIPYAEGGYTVNSGGEGLGNTPEHHSGQFYIQDGGAMSAVCALPALPRDAKVADLCAAPGGKSTQLASLIGDEGVLLSNEIVYKRTVILAENLTRIGVRNAIITMLDTSRLAELYEGVFDAVVADAPCSGEGMFRKGETAINEWSEENVAYCATRQKEILSNASRMVKPSGHLLYSTCTYSLEENEMQVDAFLAEHPDFELIEIENEELIKATSDGIQFEGATSNTLSFTRRFYPHLAPGEGQFFALMKRTSGEELSPKIEASAYAMPLSREEEKIVNEFIKSTLKAPIAGRLVKRAEDIEIISHSLSAPKSGTMKSGVTLGKIRGKIFFPDHQFFSAYGRLFLRQEELGTRERADRYLRGEEIEQTSSGSGYIAVLYQGTPLGGGKASSGMIKNHYPKFLRKKG